MTTSEEDVSFHVKCKCHYLNLFSSCHPSYEESIITKGNWHTTSSTIFYIIAHIMISIGLSQR